MYDNVKLSTKHSVPRVKIIGLLLLVHKVIFNGLKIKASDMIDHKILLCRLPVEYLLQYTLKRFESYLGEIKYSDLLF